MNGPIVLMPKNKVRYVGATACSHLLGPCECGAWHKSEDGVMIIKDKKDDQEGDEISRWLATGGQEERSASDGQ